MPVTVLTFDRWQVFDTRHPCECGRPLALHVRIREPSLRLRLHDVYILAVRSIFPGNTPRLGMDLKPVRR